MPLNIFLLAAYLALMAYIRPQLGKQSWFSDGPLCTDPVRHPEHLDWMGKFITSSTMPKFASSVSAATLKTFDSSISDS
jgi:hypothetical protein